MICYCAVSYYVISSWHNDMTLTLSKSTLNQLVSVYYGVTMAQILPCVILSESYDTNNNVSNDTILYHIAYYIIWYGIKWFVSNDMILNYYLKLYCCFDKLLCDVIKLCKFNIILYVIIILSYDIRYY